MEKRTAITTPLWIKLCIPAVVAALFTFLAVSIAGGDMAPGMGKSTFHGALLVLPLVVGAKYGWTDTASVVFAFLAYFTASLVVTMALMRDKNKSG